jgi:hypothetical protein
MCRIVVFLALIFGIWTGASIAETEKPLVSITHVFPGHGRSVVLALNADGSIVETEDDISRIPGRPARSVKVITRVPEQEIAALVSRAADQVRALPERINKNTPVLVESGMKEISVREPDKDMHSQWFSYENSPSSDESARFEQAWQSLKLLLHASTQR